MPKRSVANLHPEHKKLLAEILRAAGSGPTQPGDNDSYTGSGHSYYSVSVPERRRIAKEWRAAHNGMASDDVLATIDSLFRGDSHEEKTVAAILLGYDASARREVTTRDVDRWLSHVSGWAEVDSVCQNVFAADELLADWSAWKSLIVGLAEDPNINKRRAALVLLTRPVQTSTDARLRDLAFATIDRLKPERDILITKAISWLLRSLITNHREAVVECLSTTASTLPKIAIRETRIKLETGTKSGRSARR